MYAYAQREAVAADIKSAADARAAADGLLILKTPTGLRFEFTSDIEWLEADRNHVIFHVRGEAVRVRAKLSGLESTLDAARFLRINRSAIVNLFHVKQAVALESGRYRFEMRSGRQLSSNRNCARVMRGLAAGMLL